jgi:hypothetical protein
MIFEAFKNMRISAYAAALMAVGLARLDPPYFGHSDFVTGDEQVGKPAPRTRGEQVRNLLHDRRATPGGVRAGSVGTSGCWFNRDAGWRLGAVWQWRRTVAPADAAGCRVYEEQDLRADDQVWTKPEEFE